jgi:signal transduction histidine kinase
MAQGGQLTIRGRSAGDRVAIEIADTGVGIAPDNLPRILEPLFSTKACGIGLGLAVTRAILEKHNAHLAVESEVGRGSLFRISLPAATPEQVEAVW